MEREIKFRGKRLDNGEWVYGCLNLFSPVYAAEILVWDRQASDIDRIGVDPETVGQLIGMPDRADQEIYKGDVLKHPGYNVIMGVVDFYRGCFGWTTPAFEFCPFDEGGYQAEELLIIGNIHDNPELLTEKSAEI